MPALRLELFGHNLKEVVHQKARLREVLERQQDTDPLRLLDETVEVTAFDSRDTTAYSISFPRRFFSGDEFISLLTNSLPPPISYSQDKYGILADWDILKTPDFHNRLVPLHQGSLEPYWSEFAEHHYQPFRRALVEQRAVGLPGYLYMDIATKQQVVDKIRNVVNHNPPQLSRRTIIRTWLKVEGHHISRSKLKEMSKQRQDHIIKQALEEAPNELIKRLLEVSNLGTVSYTHLTLPTTPYV